MNKLKLEDELDEVAKALSVALNKLEIAIEGIPNNNDDGELRYVRNRLVEADQMITNGADELGLAIIHLEDEREKEEDDDV